MSVKSFPKPVSGGGVWDGDIADIDLDGGVEIGAALEDADLILVDDGATGTNRKSLFSRVWTYIYSKLGLANSVPIAGIDIDGGTDIGGALADEDLILVDDGAGGTNKKCALSRLVTYMQDNLVLSILLTLLATASSNVYSPTMITTSLTVTVS